MNFDVFIQSLSYAEKNQLLQLLQEDLAAPENETLYQFFQRALDEETLSTRLMSVYANAKSQFKNDDQENPLHKPIKTISFDDLYIIKGMGRKTWDLFVKLRGY